jgi:hypothetical protein
VLAAEDAAAAERWREELAEVVGIPAAMQVAIRRLLATGRLVTC